MTERIIIELDDTELASALAQIIVIGNEGQSITGSKNLAQSLPSINREMRIILGQVPGMREGMRTYFNLKRLLRPIGVEDEALVVDKLELALGLAATILIVVRALMQRQERIERRQRQYESFIRRERGLSSAQWRAEASAWESYFRSTPG